MNRYHMKSPNLGDRRNHTPVELSWPKMAAIAGIHKREFLSDGLVFLIRDEHSPASLECASSV
jgi:hypothetical protein